jgi:hypothetical protein
MMTFILSRGRQSNASSLRQAFRDAKVEAPTRLAVVVAFWHFSAFPIVCIQKPTASPFKAANPASGLSLSDANLKISDAKAFEIHVGSRVSGSRSVEPFLDRKNLRKGNCRI